MLILPADFLIHLVHLWKSYDNINSSAFWNLCCASTSTWKTYRSYKVKFEFFKSSAFALFHSHILAHIQPHLCFTGSLTVNVPVPSRVICPCDGYAQFLLVKLCYSCLHALLRALLTVVPRVTWGCSSTYGMHALNENYLGFTHCVKDKY